MTLFRNQILQSSFLLISATYVALVPRAVAQDMYATAEQVTVKIDVAGEPYAGGSGVIVAKENNEYMILMNCHVIEKAGGYIIETSTAQNLVDKIALFSLHVSVSSNALTCTARKTIGLFL